MTDEELLAQLAALLNHPPTPARARLAWAGGFVCPACDRHSPHRDDVADGYCGRCHWWTGDPQRAWQRPELFTTHGKVPPDPPGVIRGHRADHVIISEIAG